MEKVFVDPNLIAESARMKLLDPAYEEWMLSELESALQAIDSIVERPQGGARRHAFGLGRGGRRSWVAALGRAGGGAPAVLAAQPADALRQPAPEAGRRNHRGEPREPRASDPGRGRRGGQAISPSTFGEMTRKLAESQRILVESAAPGGPGGAGPPWSRTTSATRSPASGPPPRSWTDSGDGVGARREPAGPSSTPSTGWNDG